MAQAAARVAGHARCSLPPALPGGVSTGGSSPQPFPCGVGAFRAMLSSIPMRLNKLAQAQLHWQASGAGAALQQRPQDMMNARGKMAQFAIQMQPQQRLQRQQSRGEADAPGSHLLGEGARHSIQDLARTTAAALQDEVASTPARVEAEGSGQGRQAAEVAAASGGDAAAEVASLDGKKRKRSPEEAAELLLKGMDERAAEQKAKQGTKAKGSKKAAPVNKAPATQRKPTPGQPVTYKGATIHRKNELTWRIYMKLASGKVVDQDRKVAGDENASFMGVLARIDELAKQSSS